MRSFSRPYPAQSAAKARDFSRAVPLSTGDTDSLLEESGIELMVLFFAVGDAGRETISISTAGEPVPLSGNDGSNPTFGSHSLSKNARFSAILGESRNEFCPRFCPQKDAQKPGARPDFLAWGLGGERSLSRIFFPKPPNSVKHVKDCTPQVSWHSIGMPHDCIMPSEPRNPPRADYYRLLAVQIREIVRATRMAPAR